MVWGICMHGLFSRCWKILYQNQIFRNVKFQAYTCVATETVSLTFVAKRGNFLQALKTSRDQHMWIVDSGASDHMTDSHNLFTTYTSRVLTM